MLIVNESILPQDEYIFKFGTNAGLTVVRGVSYDKLMALPLEKLELIFQPYTARTFRQFALETVVNGRMPHTEKYVIKDLADLTDLATAISSLQHKPDYVKQRKVDEIREKVNLVRSESRPFLEVLIDMFMGNRLKVSITHPVQFGTFFDSGKDDSLAKVVNTVLKQYDLIKLVHLVALPAGKDNSVSYFIHTIFPSIVRAISETRNRGRQLRGMREVVMHLRDIKVGKHFEYTLQEQIALRELLNKVLTDGRKFNETVTTE